MKSSECSVNVRISFDSGHCHLFSLSSRLMSRMKIVFINSFLFWSVNEPFPMTFRANSMAMLSIHSSRINSLKLLAKVDAERERKGVFDEP